MSQIILLDSTPLGLISNPRSSPDNEACNQWLQRQLQAGALIAISAVADYEVRRELLRAGKRRGLAKLDGLKRLLEYLPLTTATMLQAAEFWAQARQMGKPTAHDLKLDADCIIAAQAALLIADGHTVIVATSNVAHPGLFVPAARWRDIPCTFAGQASLVMPSALGRIATFAVSLRRFPMSNRRRPLNRFTDQEARMNFPAIRSALSFPFEEGKYYRRLLRGEGRSEALRQVQLRMLKAKAFAEDEDDRLLVSKNGKKSGEKAAPTDYSHPYYWASFIQSGEWRKLD